MKLNSYSVVLSVLLYILGLLYVCNLSVKRLDMSQAVCVSHLINPHPCWIWLRHVLFTPDSKRFSQHLHWILCSCLIKHYTRTSLEGSFTFCIWNFFIFPCLRFRLRCGWFSRCFPASWGHRPKVETRSAYRAHFILDTNNFHSARAARSVKESNYGLEYVM